MTKVFEPMMYQELISKADSGSEASYRRGVHQAYAMLTWFLENNDVDPKVALKQFEELAGQFRYDRKPHGDLLHEICQRLRQR